MRENEEKCRAIGFQIKSANNLIQRNLYVRFERAGLTELVGMQGPIIGYIYEKSIGGAVFQKDIEQAFDVRRSTATVMLQSLEQKGYIERRPVEHDARMKKIVLTDKAIEQNMKILQQIDAFNDELEKGLTDREKEIFTGILDKIKDNLNENMKDRR